MPKDGPRNRCSGLPDLEIAESAVLNSLSCPDAQRGYRHAYRRIRRLVLFRTEAVLQQDGPHSLSDASEVAAARPWDDQSPAEGPFAVWPCSEAADCGLLRADLAAGIRRVKGVKKLGVSLGNWLTAEQGGSRSGRLQETSRLKGKRDRALVDCKTLSASWNANP